MTIPELSKQCGIKEHSIRYAIRRGYLPACKKGKSYDVSLDSLQRKRIVCSVNQKTPLTVKTKTITGIKVTEENTEHFATTSGRDQFITMCQEAKL